MNFKVYLYATEIQLSQQYSPMKSVHFGIFFQRKIVTMLLRI